MDEILLKAYYLEYSVETAMSSCMNKNPLRT